MEKASIITIGDELLIGQVIDTNSAWLAQELNKMGLLVSRRLAVGDNEADLWKALDGMFDNRLVIITGGLGPTSDDITKPFLLRYFGGSLHIHQPTLTHIRHLWENVFKRELTELNARQAEVPDTCRVLPNTVGTAPGMWFEKNGTTFISLPGVPYEMKTIMQEYGFDEIRKAMTGAGVLHKTLETFGIGESLIADRLRAFEECLPPFIRLAYLPNYSLVRLRLTGINENPVFLEEEIDRKFHEMESLLKDVSICAEDKPMEEIVMQLLLERKKTMATAESCTGGYISHLITGIPGSSAIFDGATVTYSYELKESLLHVSPQTLKDHGAVSEEVVKQMLQGLFQISRADFGIAVSGTMGPGGGTAEKPVGTVWIAAGSRRNQITQKFHFRFGRRQNIELTAMNALNLLRKSILMGDWKD
ncbi:MAG: CinA family nicotinamide mononucleotide deamidase-related protein [Chitinophagaceae bacterium]|nr:CinA family nicotinamide mononucleotide deamidase-related protein [Bacteroidota bacterium]MCC6256897.1 CinA family nicotinamide mononucleotide deamidase-related protein [Chitinophagaceae bacterium]